MSILIKCEVQVWLIFNVHTAITWQRRTAVLYVGVVVRNNNLSSCEETNLLGSLTTSSQVTKSSWSKTALCLARYLSLDCFFFLPKIEQLTANMRSSLRLERPGQWRNMLLITIKHMRSTPEYKRLTMSFKLGYIHYFSRLRY